ncbi:MAG: hypothetical protein HYY12_05580 [Candidatus Methylomirabilis oxyfera]|nr:hypothetical protein [Candidatus Methylomirabilis oxyfera]
MVHRTQTNWLVGAMTALFMLQTACSTMMRDARVPPPAQARHCEGSEFVTSTHMATLPIPLVAFFTPRVTLNAPDSGVALNKCGGKQQVNRKVEANYALCAPTIFLSTIITLGIAGVCPANVSYEADVVD